MLNLTPHTIVIRIAEQDITIPPSGTVARVAQTYTDAEPCEGIPVVRATYGAVTGLPEGTDEPIIVSGMVLAALAGRPNTYAPDTGAGAIRDADGKIVAVTRLIAA